MRVVRGRIRHVARIGAGVVRQEQLVRAQVLPGDPAVLAGLAADAEIGRGVRFQPGRRDLHQPVIGPPLVVRTRLGLAERDLDVGDGRVVAEPGAAASSDRGTRGAVFHMILDRVTLHVRESDPVAAERHGEAGVRLVLERRVRDPVHRVHRRGDRCPVRDIDVQVVRLPLLNQPVLGLVDPPGGVGAVVIVGFIAVAIESAPRVAPEHRAAAREATQVRIARREHPPIAAGPAVDDRVRLQVEELLIPLRHRGAEIGHVVFDALAPVADRNRTEHSRIRSVGAGGAGILHCRARTRVEDHHHPGPARMVGDAGAPRRRRRRGRAEPRGARVQVGPRDVPLRLRRGQPLLQTDDHALIARLLAQLPQLLLYRGQFRLQPVHHGLRLFQRRFQRGIDPLPRVRRRRRHGRDRPERLDRRSLRRLGAGGLLRGVGRHHQLQRPQRLVGRRPRRRRFVRARARCRRGVPDHRQPADERQQFHGQRLALARLQPRCESASERVSARLRGHSGQRALQRLQAGQYDAQRVRGAPGVALII